MRFDNGTFGREKSHGIRFRARTSFQTDAMAPQGICAMVVVENQQQQEPSMAEISTIEIDIAKHVFQLHGVHGAGEVVLGRRLRRGQVASFFPALPPSTANLESPVSNVTRQIMASPAAHIR